MSAESNFLKIAKKKKMAKCWFDDSMNIWVGPKIIFLGGIRNRERKFQSQVSPIQQTIHRNQSRLLSNLSTKLSDLDLFTLIFILIKKWQSSSSNWPDTGWHQKNISVASFIFQMDFKQHREMQHNERLNTHTYLTQNIVQQTKKL